MTPAVLTTDGRRGASFSGSSQLRKRFRLQTVRPGEADPGGLRRQRGPRRAEVSHLLLTGAASPAERVLDFSSGWTSNQSRGTWMDQTSLLSGWACPPATQILSWRT
jgi:hypothetical protein